MEPSVQKVRRAVVESVFDYYRRSVNTRVPSLKEICRGEKVVKACGGACYPKKLEPIFPPELDGSGPLMKRMCKASHVPVPVKDFSTKVIWKLTPTSFLNSQLSFTRSVVVFVALQIKIGRKENSLVSQSQNYLCGIYQMKVDVMIPFGR